MKDDSVLDFSEEDGLSINPKCSSSSNYPKTAGYGGGIGATLIGYPDGRIGSDLQYTCSRPSRAARLG